MDYATLSLKELKSLTSERNLEVTGHKGHKKSYIVALELSDNELMREATTEVVEDTTLEQLETSQLYYETILPTTQKEIHTCAYPTQSVEDFINVANYINSTTLQPELELQAKDIANVPPGVVTPINANFRDGSTVITMFAPLAMLLGAVMIASVWLTIRLGVALKPVVFFVLRQFDRGLTAILKAVVGTTDYLFGDTDIDEYSQEMQEVVPLI